MLMITTYPGRPRAASRPTPSRASSNNNDQIDNIHIIVILVIIVFILIVIVIVCMFIMFSTSVIVCVITIIISICVICVIVMVMSLQRPLRQTRSSPWQLRSPRTASLPAAAQVRYLFSVTVCLRSVIRCSLFTQSNKAIVHCS